MTDIYYPHEYLPLPLQDNYGFKPVDNLLRTQMLTGLAIQRRRFVSTPASVTVKWLCTTDAQAQAFMAWHRDALLGGGAWFMMKLKTPIGVGFYKSRFTSAYEGPTLVGGKYWQFSATLEVREMPMPPAGWGNYPEWLSGQSLLDIALNKEWPKHDRN